MRRQGHIETQPQDVTAPRNLPEHIVGPRTGLLDLEIGRTYLMRKGVRSAEQEQKNGQPGSHGCLVALASCTPSIVTE